MLAASRISAFSSPATWLNHKIRSGNLVPEPPKFGRTLEAPIPKMSGLVKKIGPFSKRKNPL